MTWIFFFLLIISSILALQDRLTQLPNELIRSIIKQLKNSTDVRSISETSNTFYNESQSSRQFSSLLNHLHDHCSPAISIATRNASLAPFLSTLVPIIEFPLDDRMTTSEIKCFNVYQQLLQLSQLASKTITSAYNPLFLKIPANTNLSSIEVVKYFQGVRKYLKTLPKSNSVRLDVPYELTLKDTRILLTFIRMIELHQIENLVIHGSLRSFLEIMERTPPLNTIKTLKIHSQDETRKFNFDGEIEHDAYNALLVKRFPALEHYADTIILIENTITAQKNFLNTSLEVNTLNLVHVDIPNHDIDKLVLDFIGYNSEFTRSTLDSLRPKMHTVKTMRVHVNVIDTINWPIQLADLIASAINLEVLTVSIQCQCAFRIEVAESAMNLEILGKLKKLKYLEYKGLLTPKNEAVLSEFLGKSRSLEAVYIKLPLQEYCLYHFYDLKPESVVKLLESLTSQITKSSRIVELDVQATMVYPTLTNALLSSSDVFFGRICSDVWGTMLKFLKRSRRDLMFNGVSVHRGVSSIGQCHKTTDITGKDRNVHLAPAFLSRYHAAI